MADLIRPARALISVSDKAGLEDLAYGLADRGIELISTGGTAATLRQAGHKVTDVAELTGFPEMMDGRVKTLHPKIHGGLLALRDKDSHIDAMEREHINPIDILVVNLYPFEATIAQRANYETCVENIDIGGPAMIRAAAKNHKFVTVVVDPQDYPILIEELAQNGGNTRQQFRSMLAQIAYARVAAYDAAVSNWMAGALQIEAPRRVVFAGRLAQPLRYGENPHQDASFYRFNHDEPGIADARQMQGKELSYNNINDTDAAFALVSEFNPADGPACAIIKHANPCGVARAATLCDAFRHARDCDATSAFGGIVALNQPLDAQTAKEITAIFTEVVIAPGASPEAQEIFATKKNLRLLLAPQLATQDARREFRQVDGGFLLQSSDRGADTLDSLKSVTQNTPDAAQMADLKFAWIVAKHVKSNAIVYVKDQATVGIGAGQMSRVDSARIAARKAEDMKQALGLEQTPTQGAAVASDAFFPFADGLIALAEAGASAVIQPGGAMRDNEVIDAANAAGMAMIFTGKRHFKH